MNWVMDWWCGSAWQKLAPRRAPLVVGPVALDVVGQRVLVGGRVVHLPDRETAIREVLMRNPGRVIPVSELAGAIGEQADRARQIARCGRRLARWLALSPLHAPLVESVPAPDTATHRSPRPSTTNPISEIATGRSPAVLFPSSSERGIANALMGFVSAGR